MAAASSEIKRTPKEKRAARRLARRGRTAKAKTEATARSGCLITHHGRTEASFLRRVVLGMEVDLLAAGDATGKNQRVEPYLKAVEKKYDYVFLEANLGSPGSPLTITPEDIAKILEHPSFVDAQIVLVSNGSNEATVYAEKPFEDWRSTLATEHQGSVCSGICPAGGIKIPVIRDALDKLTEAPAALTSELVDDVGASPLPSSGREGIHGGQSITLTAPEPGEASVPGEAAAVPGEAGAPGETTTLGEIAAPGEAVESGRANHSVVSGGSATIELGGAEDPGGQDPAPVPEVTCCCCPWWTIRRERQPVAPLPQVGLEALPVV